MTTKPKNPQSRQSARSFEFYLGVCSMGDFQGRRPWLSPKADGHTAGVPRGSAGVSPGPRWRGPGQRVALPAAPASTHAPGGLGARGVFCVCLGPLWTVPGPLCEGHCINNKLYCIIYQASSAHRKKHSKPLTIKVTNSSIRPGAS